MPSRLFETAFYFHLIGLKTFVSIFDCENRNQIKIIQFLNRWALAFLAAIKQLPYFLHTHPAPNIHL